jgi:hypothetical protein
MNLKLLLIAGVCIFTTACQNQKNDAPNSIESTGEENLFDFPDSLSARRISFVLQLKKSVAEIAWPAFGEKGTEGTLIYFDRNHSEVFFPNARVIQTLEDYNKYSDDYILTTRTDSLPHHMENMLSFDEKDSARFFYQTPVEQYSSVEEIGNFINSVESTEMWSTMVIHEMFHHFQLNNENYKDYARTAISNLDFNPMHMNQLCLEDQNFLNMIQKENDILMKAISEVDPAARDSLIASYLDKRESRIEKYSQKYPELKPVENFYIIQEGSARYIEYQSMLLFSQYASKADPIVIADDPKFSSYSEFKEIDLNSEAFNYLIYPAPSDYHYVIGFNIMRLLDELKIEYKKDLLDNPEKGLHQYLEDYKNTLPDKG